MHINTMRAGLERGEAQIGTWLTMVRSPAILSLMKAAGQDFARVDMEHTALTIERITGMALVSRALNLPIAVRPPKANREWITRLLDIGVWNLHCPQVENLAHAQEIVAASRYAPLGLRGNGGLSASTEFNGTLSAKDRREHANRKVFVTVMFETRATFADLDAIAALPGIDALTIGPVDLSDVDILYSGDSAAMKRIKGC
jgi:2-dehydro-3-deoxyglucarate aldolase/4-hydroxy-2-oxoheptanedioate aldolase